VLRFPLLATAILALSAGHAAAEEAGAKPLFSYTGAFSGVVAGGRSQIGSYVHTLSFGAQQPVAGDWSVTVQGAATAGYDLSAKAIGDVAGVQGPFNSGNGLWLYEVKATYETKATLLQFGRIAAGDALPGVSGMDQFVNSAFSSNGGAIAVNDPGRATTPTSTWGFRGRRTYEDLELRGGAFLSDPARMTLRKHGLDMTFRPADGVLAYAEAVRPLSNELKLGLGGYGDSARTATFEGRPVRGDEGAYAWIERPAPDKGGGVSGFGMVQVAPREDRNLQPLFLIGGLTWKGLVAARPEDSVSVGATAGRFSRRSNLKGWETTLEANYRVTVSEHVGLRPDLQYVIAPGGRGAGRNALVLGVQLEASL
jgi:porin